MYNISLKSHSYLHLYHTQVTVSKKPKKIYVLLLHIIIVQTIVHNLKHISIFKEHISGHNTVKSSQKL